MVFFSGSCIVLSGDVFWWQLSRRGTISNITRPFIAIFVVNILLWIDFNVTIVRRQKRELPASRLVNNLSRPEEKCRCFRRLDASLESTVELLAEDPAYFVLISPILCCGR